MAKTSLSADQQKEILRVLKTRFEKNSNRHKGLAWDSILQKLKAHRQKLWSLYEMERTGGEPDLIGTDKRTGEYLYCDCSAESPSGRRSLCYDQAGLDSRKENKPLGSAMAMASNMGIELLTEDHYFLLQETGKYDTKTSSWISTPSEVRKLGGALFADFRYGRVFVYHNSAPSYYAARGFRGLLRI